VPSRTRRNFCETGFAVCAPELREDHGEFARAKKRSAPAHRVDGTERRLHNHSSGATAHRLEEIAEYMEELGLAYWAIRHSKVIVSGNGLDAKRVRSNCGNQKINGQLANATVISPVTGTEWHFARRLDFDDELLADGRGGAVCTFRPTMRPRTPNV